MINIKQYTFFGSQGLFCDNKFRAFGKFSQETVLMMAKIIKSTVFSRLNARPQIKAGFQ